VSLGANYRAVQDVIQQVRCQSGANSRFVAIDAEANYLNLLQWMGGRVVEGTGLENRQTRKRLEGSNPSPSAILADNTLMDKVFSEALAIYPSIYPSLPVCCFPPSASTCVHAVPGSTSQLLNRIANQWVRGNNTPKTNVQDVHKTI
jgi:hypothetical protein